MTALLGATRLGATLLGATHLRATHLRATLLLAALLLAAPLADRPAHATTPNSPAVDGLITIADVDWDDDEKLHEDPIGDSAWGPRNDLQGLWVTWDATNLYIGVQGQLWDVPGGQTGSNSVNVYLDVDFGGDTGIADFSLINQNALGAISRNLWRPLTVGAGFGCDFGFTNWAGRFDLGFLDLANPAAPVNRVTEILQAKDLAGHTGFELAIPWAVLYPNAAGTVPAGTRIALVVAQVGGGDSLSPESIPDGAEDRSIDAPIDFTVDANGDGAPDDRWPPAGKISGTVTLSDPLDTTTRMDVVALRNGTIEVARTQTPPGGGAYSLNRLPAGTYTVRIDSRFYLAAPVTGIAVAENQEVAGVDFAAVKVNGGVDVAFRWVDGPDATVRARTILAVLIPAEDVGDPTPEIIGEAEIGPAAPLAASFRPVRDGNYKLMVAVLPLAGAPTLESGYEPLAVDVVVANDSVTNIGTLDLLIVKGTSIAFFSPPGAGVATPPSPITAALTTVSVPDVDFYNYLPLQVGFRDEHGHEALLDDAVKGNVTLTLTTMDPAFPPDGAATLWALPDTTAAAQPLQDAAAWDPGVGQHPVARATFLFTDDLQEVVRVRAVHPTAGEALLEVGVLPILPDHIDLTLEGTQMVAGQTIVLRGQLKDVSNNDVRQPDIEVKFEVTPAGAGVVPPEVPTLSNGSFGSEGNVVFASTVADTFTLRAFADVGDTIYSETLEVVVVPAAPDHLALSGFVLALEHVQVDVRLEDFYGNLSPLANASVDLDAGPPEIVASLPRGVTLQADGTGSFEVVTRPGAFGLLEVNATLASLPVPSTSLRLEILPGLAAVSERAPESDDAHNARPDVDLTTMFAYVERDTLVVKVPFATVFGGAHMTLLLEFQGDAAGAITDYFGFPVSFQHPLLPDYVFTYKYQEDGYADFRRPPPGGDPSAWEWFDILAGTWVGTFADGVNARTQNWVGKTATDVTFRVPVALFGGSFTVGQDTLRLQAYITQEENCKRPALDSVPDDATADLVPLIEGLDWCQQLFDPSILSQWGVVVPVETARALALQNVAFTPQVVTQGETTVLTARPAFTTAPPPSPVFQVFADLTVLGGDSRAPLNDQGRDGDAVAGDGVFSLQWRISPRALPAEPTVSLQALELTTGARTTATAGFAIVGTPELVPIVAVADSLGDDHGPNQPGQRYLYYEYPTSGVFFDGVFDLAKLEVFDVDTDLLFRVSLRDITDPSQSGAADWRAPFPSDATCPPGSRVDLNLQNLVVLIDSQTGGSQKLPDNRRADVALQDAWEYALVADGWWKGLVSSNNSDNQGSWGLERQDQSIYFCASSEDNTVDIFVDKQALGFAADADTSDVASAVRRWDMITLLSGHDGDSNDNNWGAVRWVNESIAEWQFGGGRNADANAPDRDPNIIDLLTRTGAGNVAGRPQEEQLDFLTAAAQARYELNNVAVELEAELLVDTAPPRVTFLRTAGRALTEWSILTDSPVAVLASVQDRTGVEWASLRWRGLGEARGVERMVPLGLLRSDLEEGVVWVGDIRWSDVAANGITNLVDRRLPDGTVEPVRYIVVSFDAEDVLGNRTDPASRQEFLVELPVEPVRSVTYSARLRDIGAAETLTLELPEGSQLRVSNADLLAALAGDSLATLQLVYEAVPLSDLDLRPSGGANESVLRTDNRLLGAARRLTMLRMAADSTVIQIPRALSPLELSLHIPRYAVGDTPAYDLQAFAWNDRTHRWVLVGGHGELGGSTVTVVTRDLGLYAVFTKASEVDASAVVTGLQLSPNPFSPNDDGIYDLLNVSYVLPDETREAILEIYDLRGERVRTLVLFQGEPTVNRTVGLQWDGKDEGNRFVPAGIYLVRVQVRGLAIDRWERETAAVAVVR